MAEYPALPLFTDAYMADTRHLTTTQHGAYLLLLMTAWRMPDCKLPDDDVLLARWAGLNFRNWRKMRPLIIDQFFKKDADGKLQQCRLLDERNYADSRRRKNSEAGKASALKRKERGSTTVPTKPQPKSNPHTHTHIDIDKSISSLVDNKFEEFWQNWMPYKMTKGSKAKAMDAYKKSLGETNHETIIRASKQYLDNCRVTDCKSKHAVSWLNAKGWADDDATGAVKATGGSGYGAGQQIGRPTALELALADKTHR